MKKGKAWNSGQLAGLDRNQNQLEEELQVRRVLFGDVLVWDVSTFKVGYHSLAAGKN